MASFYKYETVDIPITFTPTGVLENYKHIVVSIVQIGIAKVEKNEDELEIDVENDRIIVSLSQEETGKFSGGDEEPREALVQVNIYYNDQERDVSAIGKINVYNNLHDQVIDDE